MAEDTLQQDVEQVQDPQVDPATQDGTDDTYFLEVDDRTKYKTVEDAQKAYHEAGERIAQLSTWEKEIGKVYGADPSQIAAALDDYIKIKSEQERAAADKGKPAVESATHTDDVQLTPKEQEALKWLQKVAPKLGFVPKKELDEVRSALAELRTGNEENASARLETQIATGQGTLKGLIKENKLPDSPEFASFVEDAVAGWVNQSQARQTQWHKGGSAAQDLLKQGFEYVMNGTAALRSGTAKPTYQGRNSGTTGTVKRLPQVGSKLATGKTTAQQPKKLSAQEIHEAGWAAATKKWTGSSGDSGE